MALIRYGEGQQRSGSMGATVYSHNRFGQYIRARTIPVNPSTQRQVDVRNIMQNLTIQWGTVLTQVQRDAWSLYASNITWLNALSEAVFLTGLNHYVRSNLSRMMCGLAKNNDAPCEMYLAIPEQSLAATASAAAGQLTLTFDDTAVWTTETGGFQIFFMGKPVSPARTFYNGPYKHADCQFGQDAPNGEPSSPRVVASPWPLCEGCRIWVRSRIARADGRLSDFANYNFLCGA